ncbi:cytochrome subunit of sulfide dehydrogenase [Fulvimarina pelagi HTCC2506]|uniref:Cytochrome subunit of sulfide dehydrogenase n=2 Tax=Fulvimarina pelagi TaxID=217511 RepID=Q0G1J6_9HYPH|nr:hypothetical protein [Fulvimarina pelagi]EAU41085.1 cytochrome subunit of sulfide dehydrogenase [Fulvimarina pelagi HTCC2506]BAT30901.1 cytochrome subunit of sulfide dehydrogenase [Fulvimarina pelagi]
MEETSGTLCRFVAMSAFGAAVMLTVHQSLTSPAFAEGGYEKVEKAIQQVIAAPVDKEYGEYLAGECATCHSSHADPDAEIPQLVGRSSEDLIRAMVEYRTGYRDNQVMQTTMATKSDEEIASLAAWFASN